MTDLDTLQAETESALAAATDLRALDAIRVGVLGKTGRLTAMLKELGRATPDERRERGAALNRLRDSLTAAIEARRNTLEGAALDARLAAERIDVTLPPPPEQSGLIHPISRTMEEMAALFGAMGFRVGEGQEIQTDWFNFSALNIPAHHPARADHGHVLPPGQRGTGTSARCCGRRRATCRSSPCWGEPPPLRLIAPGRVYRSDHDATHSSDVPPVRGPGDRPRDHAGAPEGLPDRFPARLSSASLPCPCGSARSYFPFTEPSMEVDIGWDRRSGETRRRRATGWRSWAAAWCIRACSPIAGWTRGSGRASRSGWAWSA